MIVARVLFSDDPCRLRRIFPGRTERDPVYFASVRPVAIDDDTAQRTYDGVVAVLRRIAAGGAR